MRIRTIKPEFFKHDVVASLDPRTRLLFIGLWCLADCKGRLEDRPKRIGVEVLPYDQDYDVDVGLAALDKHGLITRYNADGKQLIQVVSFASHQRITGKEAEYASRFPSPHGETTVKQLGNTCETHETTGNGKETEGKRFSLPKGWHEDWIAELEIQFPGIDIKSQLRRAAAYQRKRGAKLERDWFVSTWLKRASPEVPVADSDGTKIDEPAGWREYMQSEYPGCVFVDEASPRYAATWAQLPADYQKLVADKLNKRSAA